MTLIGPRRERWLTKRFCWDETLLAAGKVAAWRLLVICRDGANGSRPRGGGGPLNVVLQEIHLGFVVNDSIPGTVHDAGAGWHVLQSGIVCSFQSEVNYEKGRIEQPCLRVASVDDALRARITFLYFASEGVAEFWRGRHFFHMRKTDTWRPLVAFQQCLDLILQGSLDATIQSRIVSRR